MNNRHGVEDDMPFSIEQMDSQLVGTTAGIRYTLTFPNAAQHLATIVMEVDTDPARDGGKLEFVMPNWIPGSYKVRDFISFQGDLVVTDSQGNNLPFEWVAKNRLQVRTDGASQVRLSYVYYSNERTVRQSHVNRFHAFLNPANCMMAVEGRRDEIHHVIIHHPWKQVSTSLSPVSENTWGALNYDILIDSPVEIGDHYVATYERHGAQHEIAITGAGDFDADWLTEQTKIIIDKAVEMWGGLPYDRYVFIIQLLPGKYGGLEHARSSVNMFDSDIFTDPEKVVKLLVLLCHEFFHTWNVKRIRAIELGPFDYDKENYTRMLWLAEGVTSYYDDLMGYRCGFHSREGYLKALSKDHLGRLMDTPGRLSMSVKDSSYLSWVKLYVPTPDGGNRFPSYYLLGGIIFLLLDMRIIAESNGAKSLDEGMQALFARYNNDPEKGITEEEFIAIVSEATGVEIGETLQEWLNTTEELPFDATFALLGLEWRTTEKTESETFGADMPYQVVSEKLWMGVSLTEEKNRLNVARVLKGSPAEAAGIGAGDEIIALNGARVGESKKWEVMMRKYAGEASVRITAACEGVLYEVDVEPVSRETKELVEVKNPTEQQSRNLERWLRR